MEADKAHAEPVGPAGGDALTATDGLMAVGASSHGWIEPEVKRYLFSQYIAVSARLFHRGTSGEGGTDLRVFGDGTLPKCLKPVKVTIW